MTISNTKLPLSKWTTLVTEIAWEAGEKLLKFQKNIPKLGVSYKEAQGVASSADVATEKHIVKALKKLFPAHSVLGEEGSYLEGIGSRSWLDQNEFTWVIDPLDGTNNFLNNLDYYAVCIGLCHYGVPVLGVVYRPRTGEIFKAFDQGGSFYAQFKQARLSWKRIGKRTNKKPMRESIFATGFATEKGGTLEEEFLTFKALMGQSRAVRRMGSAALDMCFTALSSFDGFWERGLAPWDVCASGVVCSEAGLVLSDLEGRPFHCYNSSIVVACNPLYNDLLKFLNSRPSKQIK